MGQERLRESSRWKVAMFEACRTHSSLPRADLPHRPGLLREDDEKIMRVEGLRDWTCRVRHIRLYELGALRGLQRRLRGRRFALGRHPFPPSQRMSLEAMNVFGESRGT